MRLTQTIMLAGVGLLVTACPEQGVYVSTLGYGGGPGTGGAGASAADAGDACPGECVPLASLGWSTPALLWIGKEAKAPPCPKRAPVTGYEGHADLNAPNQCGACSCDPPSGSCTLPAKLTAAASACAGDGPGVPHTSFDAPSGWDGTCTTVNAIPAGKQCSGVPCVQSLTIAPLGLTEGACTPSVAPVPESPTATWATFGRACIGAVYGPCPTAGEVCAPTADPPPPGFAQCIFQKGDNACPSPYGVKHVFYDGLTDDRSCSACACGAPVGSMCTSVISAYKDGACTNLVAGNVVGSSVPFCVNVLPGPALGSKSATKPTYMPGPCPPSGGEPMGSAEPDGPATFCCLP